MSFDVNWNIDKYREEHECEDHWELRKAFMQRWKNNYPEERLVCLARVFANIEFMGCRYPTEIMQEVSSLSKEVAINYREIKKTKLQRTFVSASDAAEDRAKGVKREGGVVVDSTPAKSAKINFVPQGHTNNESNVVNDSDTEDDGIKQNESTVIDSDNITANTSDCLRPKSVETIKQINLDKYLNEMANVQCIDVRKFNENMFNTNFGRLVLFVRTWNAKISNISLSCQMCNVKFEETFENGCLSISINGKLLARATGESKAVARSIVEVLAWNRLKEEVISVVVKEVFVAQGERISVNDVSGRKAADQFGTPIESSVATKMMKMMGWKGGGLGADAQGIAEPIKPNMQLVNRAGLGSASSNMQQIKRAAHDLMRRFIASDTVDVDLVFSSDFSKEERAELHQVARRAGLNSRSYGDTDRFLVVRKKVNPFTIVRALVEKGGITPKYQLFIPISLYRNGR